MITKLNRRDSSPKWAFGYFWRKSKNNSYADIQSAMQFDLLIRKEISRCLRRPGKHYFGLIQTSLGADQLSEPAVVNWMIDVMKRCRITDELGVWNAQLTMLVPETDSDGTLIVANQLVAMGKSLGLQIDTNVFMFPEDDSVMQIFGSGNQARPEDLPLNNELEPVTVSESKNVDFRIDQTHNSELSAIRATAKRLGKQNTLNDLPTPLWKRALDFFGASVGLVGFVPTYLLVATLIKLDSKGPVMFSQWREGKNGRLFRIYKFRTMTADADTQKAILRLNSEQDGPAFKIENDPRITRVGYYLRKTCIDEVPQIINVLRGEMSLVGPRPLPVDESQDCRMWHRQRLSVLPGLTCIWQVIGGRKVTFEEWMRMDLEYIRKRSLGLDLKLLVLTLLKVVRYRGSV